MPRIENWKRTTDPIRGHECLAGQVFAHPYFKDGDKIFTSEIEIFDDVKELAITKSGSVYELGEPEQEDPNACQNPACDLLNHDEIKECPYKTG